MVLDSESMVAFQDRSSRSQGLEALTWTDVFPVVMCSFGTLQDSRFNAEVDLITGYKTQSILCLPIKNHRDEVSRFFCFPAAARADLCD